MTMPPAPDWIIPTRRVGPGKVSTFWTEELFERAKAMWKDGQSASQIGLALGCTRNSVIGKLNRNGLQRREGPRVSGITRVYKKRPGGYAMRAQSIEHRKEIFCGPEITELAADIADKPTTLLDLTSDHQCRWPCSGEGAATLFCGGDTYGPLPYCLRHCRIAYVPARR